MEDKGKFLDKRMEMWKRREEMLSKMDEKELRAFIKGYMMSQGMLLRMLKPKHKCNEGCGCGNCNCVSGNCNCGAEH